MAQPIRRPPAAVRAYTDRLRALMDHLSADPLDEDKSLDLITHIVTNRSGAAHLYRTLEAQIVGAPC